MVKKSKLDDMFKPKDNSRKAKPKRSNKVDNTQSREVESYHSRKVDSGKIGKRQVSFWLSGDLVEAFQIQAVREKKSNSQLLEEFIGKSLYEKGEQR